MRLIKGLLKNSTTAVIKPNRLENFLRKRMRQLLLPFLIAACFCFNLSESKAGGNHLDYTFSTNGKHAISFDGLDDDARAVTVHLLSKILVVGRAQTSNGYDFALTRLNPDGTNDTTFGTNGKVKTSFGSSDIANAVIILPTGKILVAGAGGTSSDHYFAVARYFSNGDLDTAFGTNGLATISFSTGDDVAEAIALQSDGKIVLAGSVNGESGWGIARLNSDGTLDSTFGSNGKVITNFSGIAGKQSASGVIAQSDGKIIAGGHAAANSSSTIDFALARYNSNGALDSTFGTGGKVLTDFGQGKNEYAYAFKRMSDGRFVLAGSLGVYSFALARFNPDGSLDTSFDFDGKVTNQFGNGSERINDIVVLSNGEIYAGGFILDDAPGYTFAVAHYLSDGKLDYKFGTGGRVNTVFDNTGGYAYAMALQGDGKLIAVGNNGATHRDFLIARFNPNGSAARADFDGAAQADFGVFRASAGSWFVFNSADSSTQTIPWGQAGDIPVPGDFDADGKTDAAVYRAGVWYILQSSNNAQVTKSLGSAGDIPAQGDFDGDSKTDPAVFRPSNNTWYFLKSSQNFVTFQMFGLSTDRLAPADYDGDGITDVAVFRPSEGNWYILRSTLGFTAILFGASGDRPVPADYDRDGRDDIALFRPSDNTWYITFSQNNVYNQFQWGTTGDIPAPADFDKDAKADITVFRPSDGNWYVRQSKNNTLRVVAWGTNGDIPVSSAYTPQ